MTPTPYPLAKPKVLVVDDDVQVITLLKVALQAVSQVFFTTDGTQAVAIAQSTAPDLVLLDVEMPSINGLEICRRLRSDVQIAAIPVVFVCETCSSPESRERNRKALIGRSGPAGQSVHAQRFTGDPHDLSSLVIGIRQAWSQEPWSFQLPSPRPGGLFQ